MAQAIIYSDADIMDLETGLSDLGDSVTRAKFTVEGEGGQAVSVSVPSNFSMTMGSESIDVELLPDFGSTVTLSNALGSSGSASLNIGGTFYIDSGQPTGLYSGTFTVTVAYQ